MNEHDIKRAEKKKKQKSTIAKMIASGFKFQTLNTSFLRGAVPRRNYEHTPKKSCVHCHGTGYVGREISTGTSIVCNCYNPTYLKNAV